MRTQTLREHIYIKNQLKNIGPHINDLHYLSICSQLSENSKVFIRVMKTFRIDSNIGFKFYRLSPEGRKPHGVTETRKLTQA